MLKSGKITGLDIIHGQFLYSTVSDQLFQGTFIERNNLILNCFLVVIQRGKKKKDPVQMSDKVDFNPVSFRLKRIHWLCSVKGK